MQARCYIPPAYRSRKLRLILVKPQSRVGGSRLRARLTPPGSKTTTKASASGTHFRMAGKAQNLSESSGGEGTQGTRRISSPKVNFLQSQKHRLKEIALGYSEVLSMRMTQGDLDHRGGESPMAQLNAKIVVPLTDILRTLHKQKDGSLLPATRESLLLSEEIFRGLCFLLRDMVLQWAKQADGSNDSFTDNHLRYLFGEDPQAVAEELLLALAEVRKGRAALVAQATATTMEHDKPLSTTSSAMASLGKWVSNILGLPSERVDDDDKADDGDSQEDKTKKWGIQLTGHVDPQFGVENVHLRAVMNNLIWQLERHYRDVGGASIRKEALIKAARMTFILEQCVTDDMTLDPDVLGMVLRVWAEGGTTQAGLEAQRIFAKYDPSTEWNTNLLFVLRAFRNAVASFGIDDSTKTSLLESRRETLTSANECLLQRCRSSPRLLNPIAQRLQSEAFIIMLEAYQNASNDVIPDLGNQVRELMKAFSADVSFTKLEGKDQVLQIRGTRPPTNDRIPDLDVVDAVALTYAMTGNREFVLRAVRLLNVVLAYRKSNNWSNKVPTARCVENVISAITHLKRIWRDSGEMEIATYATELIDIIYSMGNELPFPGTFKNILTLYEESKSPDAAPRAEEILSRLEIRAALEPHRPSILNVNAYHCVLNCWREAARTRPGAAVRAMRLLEKMEAQSSRPFPAAAAAAETPTASPSTQSVASKTMYNEALKPKETTYILVLQTCFNTKLESEMERALDIALEVYSKKMPGPPSADVVNTMLIGCELLTSKDSEKRATALRIIYDKAQEGGLGRNRNSFNSLLMTSNSSSSLLPPSEITNLAI